MADILQIRHEILSNQQINQSIHNVFILTRNVSGKFRLHDYLICKEPSNIVNIIKLGKYKNPLKETHNFTEKFFFFVIDSNIHWNFDAAYH